MKAAPRDVLTARPDGLADAIGRSLGARRPASVLLSIAALLCALLAVRSMAAAETERDRPVAPPPPADSPPEVAS